MVLSCRVRSEYSLHMYVHCLSLLKGIRKVWSVVIIMVHMQIYYRLFHTCYIQRGTFMYMIFYSTYTFIHMEYDMYIHIYGILRVLVCAEI